MVYELHVEYLRIYRPTIECLQGNQHIGGIMRQKPHSDILRSTDEEKVTLLGLLDLVSATFNTVNLTILQDWIRVVFRIDALALE